MIVHSDDEVFVMQHQAMHRRSAVEGHRAQQREPPSSAPTSSCTSMPDSQLSMPEAQLIFQLVTGSQRDSGNQKEDKLLYVVLYLLFARS